VDNDEGGVKLIPREQENLDKSKGAEDWQRTASSARDLAGLLRLVADIVTDVKPFGIRAGFTIVQPYLRTLHELLLKLPVLRATKGI
jgi:hypothetical protein